MKKKKKTEYANINIKYKIKTWAPTYDAFLRRWWDDAALERLLDGQLLIKTQEVTITPPHSEGFTPEHGQGRLTVETRMVHE